MKINGRTFLKKSENQGIVILFEPESNYQLIKLSSREIVANNNWDDSSLEFSSIDFESLLLPVNEVIPKIHKVRIESLPNRGKLMYKGERLSVNGVEFPYSDFKNIILSTNGIGEAYTSMEVSLLAKDSLTDIFSQPISVTFNIFGIFSSTEDLENETS